MTNRSSCSYQPVSSTHVRPCGDCFYYFVCTYIKMLIHIPLPFLYKQQYLRYYVYCCVLFLSQDISAFYRSTQIASSFLYIFSPGNTDDAFRFRKQGVNFPLTRTALLPGRDGLPFLILQAETSFSSGISLMVWI